MATSDGAPARADFTITVRDTHVGCWVTLRGNQTGYTVQRCVPSNLWLVLFSIARMWINGAKALNSRVANA